LFYFWPIDTTKIVTAGDTQKKMMREWKGHMSIVRRYNLYVGQNTTPFFFE